MTTPTREELLALANAASKDGEHIYSNPRDHHNWKANETWRRAASPEAFIALLSAHQAQGEPFWYLAKYVGEGCERRDWFSTGKTDWSRVQDHVAMPLYAAPPSSAQTDKAQEGQEPIEASPIDVNKLEQIAKERPNDYLLIGKGVLKLTRVIRKLEAMVSELSAALSPDYAWNEAIEAAAKECELEAQKVRESKMADWAIAVAGCHASEDRIRSLKRPLQAQDQRSASPAAQSGAVDLPALPFSPFMCIDWADKQKSKTLYTEEQVLEVQRQAYELGQSRAQTAPAVDLASVSDERAQEVLKHLDEAVSICGPTASSPMPSTIVWKHWLERYAGTIRALLSRPSVPAPVSEQPALTVWYGPMPESNGKSNYTAILMRRDGDKWDNTTSGITIARSEYPDRVRYEADRVRYLIGELSEQPFILDYDTDKHSGYKEPAAQTAGVPTYLANRAATLVRELEDLDAADILLNQLKHLGKMASFLREIAATPQPVVPEEMFAYRWLERASKSNFPDVVHAARTMMAYYQGAEFPEQPAAQPAGVMPEELKEAIRDYRHAKRDELKLQMEFIERLYCAAPQPVAEQVGACSVCYGSGFDVVGKPCPFRCRPLTHPQAAQAKGGDK